MHVLYSCADPGIPYWGTKGASIHVRSFTNALAAAGYDVTVVMARLGRQTTPLLSSVRLIEVPGEQEGFFQSDMSTTAEELALLSEARQFVQNRSLQDVINDIVAHRAVDIICERYSLFGLAGRESARWHNVPFVLEVNAPLVEEQRDHRRLILEPLARQIERFLFSKSDCVVTVSDPLANYVKAIASSAVIRTIPNGVDIESFVAQVNGDDWRRQWGVNGNHDRLIGFIGSLKPWHGLDLLMEAFADLRADGNAVRLVLIGDGPLKSALESEARARSLDEYLVFTGALPHASIPSISQSLDILVAPYPELDNFYFSPLKVYEYMAAGKPIVASRIGQIAEILDADRTALLVPPGDARALSDAIKRLLADEELASRLGANAQAAARSRHGWNHRVADWKSLFESLQFQATPEEVGP